MDEIPTLEDGHDWSEYVLEKWQEENREYEREIFGNLIHTLPQVYETLELFGYHKLARKLQKSISKL